MLTEVPPEQYAAVLDDVAIHILSQAGITSPPIDPFVLARILGITVAEDADQAERARYVRLCIRRGRRPVPAVLLRPEERRERFHFALAHEIGEHLAHDVFSRLGATPTEAPANTREDVANHLAGRLLVPTDWFLEDGIACGWDLFQLKARYTSASHELLARRMLGLPPQVIITIFDKGRLSFRQSNLPGRAPPLAEAEKACQERTNQDGVVSERECPPLRVQAWPIHEPDWKREILRTEVASW